jgi:hypothetical protein
MSCSRASNWHSENSGDATRFERKTVMNAPTGEERAEPSWLKTVQSLVGSLRFGVVQIVVHDGHVVQIDKTEKLRIERTERKTSAKKGQHYASIY